MNGECKKYYRNIKRLLPDTLKDRKLYLAHTRDMLEAYEAEHEAFSYDDLLADLGCPKEFSDRQLLIVGADSLRKSMTNKKIIFCSIIAAALVLVGLIIFGVSDKEANVVYREPSSQVNSEVSK